MDNMQKNLSTLIAALLGVAATGAQAAGVLSISDGVGSCVLGGTYPDSCLYGLTGVASGSYFAMDLDSNGIFDPGDKTVITATGLFDLDDTTAATGSHAGSIDGSETPVFDIWEFSGAVGMDYLTSAASVSATGAANVFELDMGGWSISWNGIAVIPMGGDTANFPSDTGIGTLTCESTCAAGEAYTMDYTAHVPLADPSAKGGTFYGLHLEGFVNTDVSVSAVPVPAAVWLFGSGLLGLVGVARRKKA